MSYETYKFEFEPQVPMRAVKDTLVLAVLAAEALHGRSVIRLDAAFRLDEEKRTCVVGGTSAVGRSIAKIFVGILAREFGELSFRVDRATATDSKRQTRARNTWPLKERKRT